MKKYEMIEFKNAYQELKALSGTKDFYIPLVKNIKLAEIELEGLELLKEKTKGFKEFMEKKEKLLEKYASKDEHGAPVKTIQEVDGMKYYKYDIPDENRELIEADGKELIEKYKEDIEATEEKEKKYVEAMNAECTVNFHKIKEDALPKEMTPELFEIIESFVEYEG